MLFLHATGGPVLGGLVVLAISDQVDLTRGLVMVSMGVLVVGFGTSSVENISSSVKIKTAPIK